MKIAIANAQVPFIRGGAEILVEDLARELTARGHQVEVISIPCKTHPLDCVLKHMLACRLVDLTETADGPIDLFIGMKFPVYLTPHSNKVLWIIHQFRQTYDLWNHRVGLSNLPDGAQVREAILQADRKACGEARRVFTISQNVSRRLKHYLDVDSEPLYPPPRNAARFWSAEPGDYLFFPSRLSLLKRHGLVLEALARCRQPVRLRFAGRADTEEYKMLLEAKAQELGIADQVEWLGGISEEEMVSQYANALAVVFPPQDEDYGYVTLEAMLAAKPVLTCSDSGGPLEFVVHGETGWVAQPNPRSLAEGLDELWERPARARRWGDASRRRYDELGIGWDRVIEGLLP